jgi:predicted mannosyl-3-phosphoglycerate phosphatase (HAD superfamily)
MGVDTKWLADRIEELEAKLEKAIEALAEAICLLDPDEEDIAKWTGFHRIVTTYAELTGGKDE